MIMGKRILYLCGIVLFTFTTIYASNSKEIKVIEENKMKNMDLQKFYKYKNASGIYEFTLPNGISILQRGRKEKSFFETRLNPKSPLFEEYRAYYGTGELWSQGVEYRNRFDHGISYTYDKQGNITDRINHDEGYIYTWENIYKYCNLNNIDLFDKLTSITKFSRNNLVGMYDIENSIYSNTENTLLEKDAFSDYETKKGTVSKIWRILHEAKAGTLRRIYIDAKQGNIIYMTEGPISDGKPSHYKKGKGAIFIDNSKIIYWYAN